MNQKSLVFGLICLGFGIVMTGTFSAMLAVWLLKEQPLYMFPLWALGCSISALLLASGFIADAFPEAKEEPEAGKSTNSLSSTPNS